MVGFLDKSSQIVNLTRVLQTTYSTRCICIYLRAAGACVDDLYLRTLDQLCVHEQKAHGLQWVQSIGTKNALFVTLVDCAKGIKASAIPTQSLPTP